MDWFFTKCQCRRYRYSRRSLRKFFPDEVQESEDPFVLLAGGIGLTPNLSILRHEHEKNSNRRIHLVWGLAIEEDMFMIEEFGTMKAANPNFSYDIIFSNQEHLLRTKRKQFPYTEAMCSIKTSAIKLYTI